MGEPSAAEVRARLLAWYDLNRRDLPWRRSQDPFRILVSEFLLQRTRVASGTPYYERFLARFPTVRDLASARRDEVLAAWEGLGFYRRAEHLHAAAQAIVKRHGGTVPRTYEALAALPGIGPYTAGAVASIAFGLPVPAVDGNVTRVIARLYRLRSDTTRPETRRRIADIAGRLVSTDRPGAFNQAMMELGATVCTPLSPACDRCPVERLCLARAAGEEREIPLRRPRVAVRTVRVAFALIESKGRVLLVRRKPGELLGGLWSLPGGEMPSRRSEPESLRGLVREQTGIAVEIRSRWSPIARTFSHRKWSGSIFRGSPRGRPTSHGDVRWIRVPDALRLPLVPFHRAALRSLEGLETFEGQ